uniref:Protein phosphatase inhibitor 2 family member C n=1 Tax=Balaenoptera musculus TaxID=9771 RepID=A0A8C0DQV2_BALMU
MKADFLSYTIKQTNKQTKTWVLLASLPRPPGVDGGADGGGDHCGITCVRLCDTGAGKSQKDNDFMKMNEPRGAKSDFETKEALTLDSLANKLATTDTSELNYPVREPEKDGVHTSKIFLDKQEKQRQFEMKRKLHYNRGLNIKLARQFISKDLQREDEEDENKESWHATSQDKTTTMEESEEGPTSDEELSSLDLSYPLHPLFPQSSWGIHSTRLYGVS